VRVGPHKRRGCSSVVIAQLDLLLSSDSTACSLVTQRPICGRRHPQRYHTFLCMPALAALLTSTSAWYTHVEIAKPFTSSFRHGSQLSAINHMT
jgi:hypothetical protein